MTFLDDDGNEICPACGKRVASVSMDDLYGEELPEGAVCENDPHFFHPAEGLHLRQLPLGVYRREPCDERVGS